MDLKYKSKIHKLMSEKRIGIMDLARAFDITTVEASHLKMGRAHVAVVIDREPEPPSKFTFTETKETLRCFSVRCPSCNGTGQVIAYREDAGYCEGYNEKCQRCGGSGEILEKIKANGLEG